MIRLPFASWFRNKLDKLWEKEKIEIQKEYVQKQNELIHELGIKQSELESRIASKKSILQEEVKEIESLEKRLSDRKSELERSNRELREQIRIIEAKSKPDRVWESAFSLGFSKAWDMMLPHMTEGINKIKESVRSKEIEDSLIRLTPMVNERIENLQLYSLRDMAQVDAKKKEFELKKSASRNQDEIRKLENYIHVLNWLMEPRNGN